MKIGDYLSVIIPYYNTRKWCEPLIKKLIHQKEKYPETEIILIDDHSTEDITWLDDYRDDIIVIRNFLNFGVSYSRNVGVIISRGDYIQFVDSDDDITDDFLDVIYTNIRKGYDYLIYHWISNGKRTDGEIPKDSIKWNWAVWGYTFTRKMIGDERFNENMNAMEDWDWLNRILKPTQNRGVVNTPIYIYNTDNENSICRSIDRGDMERERKNV